MKIGDVLAYFKQNESAESIMPLVDNAELRNGLVAWKSVVVNYKSMSDCTEKDDAKKWEWMWTQIEFDVRQFGVVAGVRGQDSNALFMRLKGLRLIYPDGTINTIAAKYLQAIVMSKLPKPKAKPKSEDG